MAYNRKYDDDDSLDKTMLYDLRSVYAYLVGEHMHDVTAARKSDNYPMYLKSLDDLYVIIKHKIDLQTNKEEGVIEDEYKKLKDAVELLANKHQTVWVGSNKDQTLINELEQSLKKLERYLYSCMEDADMFGAKYHYDPDEI